MHKNLRLRLVVSSEYQYEETKENSRAHPSPTTRARAPQVRHWLTRVDCDEYDRALAATPHVCRPFADAMGDRRPARRCLAQYPEDRARSLAGLAATVDGARRLGLLARAVAARLGGPSG